MMSESESLASFLVRTESLTVLSGAGVSTASGIPDYRDRNGDWKNAQPIQYVDFVTRLEVRQRYWARSYAGWQRIAEALPNGAHRALARLEASGRIDTLITQNVDGLHRIAGSRQVIDLHGNLESVRCLSCNASTTRRAWQDRLATLNPDWQIRVSSFAADGDAELIMGDDAEFTVPECRECGGIVKPDVVFFGEAVPKERVHEATEAVNRAKGLLIVGSSLMVYSGFRFARQADKQRKPIAIVNRGRTRADEFAALKLDTDCEAILIRTVELLDA